ncbi:Sacsin [Bagarius yarrelli]|uniref:Sacsin n=1 Tax=Bagarius yarrelli TaxID=175774 RepID=A0A556TIN1_BAGYA|nr:Sacsin [Bagarius yarrelli]
MGKPSKKVIRLVEGHPDGIPLSRLAVFYNQKYHHNLIVSEIGFSSVADFIGSLNEHLVVKNGTIFHRNHLPQTQDTATENKVAQSLPEAFRNADNDKTSQEVLELIQEHPEGIPINQLATLYNIRYRKNLIVSKLGFASLSSFVKSMSNDLLVKNGSILHKMHRVVSERPALQKETLSTVKANSKMSDGTTCTRKEGEMSKVELLKKVKEVIQVYPDAATSITQLMNGYFLHFGSILPLGLYISLYDSQTSTQTATVGQAQVIAGHKTGSPPTSIKMFTSATASPQHAPVTEEIMRSKSGSPVWRLTATPPPSDSSLTSSIDFPPLTTRPSRAEDRRHGQEGSKLVFREAHHAQLREVHGANVRAVEALEINETTDRRKTRPSLEEVNNLAEDAIQDLAAQGEHVTVEKVTNKVCRLLQVPSLNALGIRSYWQLPALKELERTIKEINLFVQSIEATTSMCTLYELGHAIASIKNKKRFEELQLGPLSKIPIIHRLFTIDSNTKDDDIHQIETVDLLRSLRNFRRKQNKPKVDLAEFLQYLADQYNCDSPYALGIRIQSVGLPISTLSKAYGSENASLERARETIQKEIEEEVQTRLWKIKKTLLEPAQGSPLYSSYGSLELRKKYTTLTASEAVLEVFKNSVGIFNQRMTKRVQEFLTNISEDRLARTLFQLAICGGSLAIPNDLAPKEKPQKQTQEQSASEKKATEMLPTEDAVKQYFLDTVSSFMGTVTLSYLNRLERTIAKHFRFKEFSQLHQGSFLEFLVKNMQVLQDAAGGAVAIANQEVRANGFRPSKQDVYEFIKQCGETDPSKLPFIEAAIRSHYKVQDSRELGYGKLHTLADFARHQKELDMLVNSEGLLGDVSREQAVASLLSAPLLEDLAEWSQWELVFQSNHGPLKHFIDKYCGNTDLLALEVSPGVLLRITSVTGDKFFSQASQALDPAGTAGHLVSIVVRDGILNTPTALLANLMESSLAAAAAKEDPSLGEDRCSFSIVAKFVLDCVSRMPTRICRELLQQVFLEPLSKVLGQARSKIVLLDTAKSEVRYLNKLHQLGIMLGITEWVKDFHNKLILPPTPELPQQNLAADSSSSDLSSVLSLADSEDLLETFQQDINDCIKDNVEDDSEDDAEDEDEDLFELASEKNKKVNGSVESKEEDEETNDVDSIPKGHAEEDETFSEQLSQQMAIIEDIRKNEFGVGVELNEAGQNLMKKQQARLGRSLERLSTELYSKDTHFVLELIQNADDNSYPLDRKEEPALAFIVQKDCITILNNEFGFEEKNVRAICDVGKSTKGKHTCGYIGQKGIGFKSVFKVTDCPEIHSNDFHIQFDKASGPMGYILPHWVEEERHVPLVAKEIAEKSWTTKIFLPLRSESYQTKNLFHDVHPSLLLFLHRLRSITIYSEAERKVVSMMRRDLNHNVLEVEHTGGVERWLVVKKILYPEKVKVDVESTELALAFQLNNGSEDKVKVQPRQQPVFAFLPLRSFGFRFVIQGDFDIPSSREDVDRDSSWNQWLRSEIPQLFLQAMDVFTTHPEFSGLQGLCHFLQYIPQPSEILDFFNPVAKQIIQLLKGKPCLPAKMDSNGGVQFKLPSQVAVCQDPLIQDVIGGEELCKHLNLSYLHPELQSSLSSSLLSALGVQRLKAANITTVICAMAKSLVQEGDIYTDSNLKKLAKLLACNFRALESEYNEVDSLLQALRDIPMIPLADGRVVALSAEGVFFPLSEETHKGLNALYKDLSIVEPRLLECLDKLGNSQVRELLCRLEVHELEPKEVLQNHIYPILKQAAWKEKPEKITVSYLVFIKEHSQEQDYRALREAIPVLTNKGFLCPGQCKVQFSKEYGNIDLPNKLPGVDWVLLDSCYLCDGDLSGWRDFLSDLGVRDLLIFKKERRNLKDTELVSSPWAAEAELWPKPTDKLYVIEDQQCEELHSLITADQLPPTIKLQQRQALINLLQNNWDTGYPSPSNLLLIVLDNQGRTLKDTRSSFYYHLTQLAWMPSYKPTQDEKNSVEYLIPNRVYLFSNKVHSLLGSHVFYVNLDPSEFSRAVGMRHTVVVDEMISYLKRWCTKESDSGEAEGADFITTAQHIHTVYLYLQAECSHTQLRDLFQHSPAVYIEYDRKDEWSSGRFYHLKDVCWRDPTDMFVRYKELIRKPDSRVQEPKVLAPFYSKLPQMEELFKSLNVYPSPSMKQYVDLLETVCESSPLPTGEVLQDVSIIFARLADKCKNPTNVGQDQDIEMNQCYCMTLKEMVSRLKVFPTKTQGWVTLARKPMIADSPSLEKIFKSYKEVCLLNLPSAQKKVQRHKPNQKAKLHDEKLAFNEGDRELFLEICGVKKLSQCVTTEPTTELYRPCPAMQNLVRNLIPYIQRFIYHHDELGEIYDDLKENGIAQEIKSLSFGPLSEELEQRIFVSQVGMLYINYRLEQPDESPIVESEDIICLLKDRKELYIQKDHLSSKMAICRELVKLFTTEKSFVEELKHFLEELVIRISDPDSLKRLLDGKNIQELPQDEERWEVPAPLETFEPRTFTISSSGIVSAEEEEINTEEDTLHSWPPKASISKTGGRSTGKGSQAVEAVMKMWPPPAPLTSSAQSVSPAPSAHWSSGAERSPSNLNSQERTTELQIHREPGSLNIPGNQEPRERAGIPRAEAQTSNADVPVVQGVEAPNEAHAGSNGAPDEHTEVCVDKPENSTLSPAEEQQPTLQPTEQVNKPVHPPEVMESQFQGSAIYRPPMPLDSAVWTKPTVAGVLEDLALDFSLPNTLQVPCAYDDSDDIGRWGEQLVYSFLTRWRESGEGPREISWSNEKGESGQPYDFKLIFPTGCNTTREVFVEVKTTVKQERHFIHMSANEIDFALKEKEKYHIYRVYGAGDSQHTRLCRIKNLAQHLHSKTLELFLFV